MIMVVSIASNEFEDYYSTNGIHRQKTIPRTLQENGVAECMNRTIMEHARSMRLHVGLPLQMWAEAINTIVYLINRGPSTSLGCGILEEAWTGKKVSYSFLKTFGCEAFAHIDSKNRTKLEAKSKKCVKCVKCVKRVKSVKDMTLMNFVLGFGILKIVKL